MKGRARAAEREIDMALFEAWHTAALTREKRLKPLAKYRVAKKAKAESPAEMLATLREIKARGAKMTIKRRSSAGSPQSAR